MNPKSPFFKPFIVAIPFFILNVIPIFTLFPKYATYSYDPAVLTGRVLFNHLATTGITGLLRKTVWKNSSWGRTALIYFVVLLAINLLQKL